MRNISRPLALIILLAVASCSSSSGLRAPTEYARGRLATGEFEATLFDASGLVVATCRAPSRRACQLDVNGSPPGSYRLRLALGEVAVEGALGLRGSESEVGAAWASGNYRQADDGPPFWVQRLHRAPPSLSLSLPAFGPTRRWDGDLPRLMLLNSTPATLRGTSIEDNFFGFLQRRDERGHWKQVGGFVGCGTVEPATPLAPGASVVVGAPDYMGGREEVIMADAQYRFVLTVKLDDDADWDRHASALGATPLVGRDSVAFFHVEDVIKIAIELDGAAILGAQGPALDVSRVGAP